jgi:hypothetical protein
MRSISVTACAVVSTGRICCMYTWPSVFMCCLTHAVITERLPHTSHFPSLFCWVIVPSKSPAAFCFLPPAATACDWGLCVESGCRLCMSSTGLCFRTGCVLLSRRLQLLASVTKAVRVFAARLSPWQAVFASSSTAFPIAGRRTLDPNPSSCCYCPFGRLCHCFHASNDNSTTCCRTLMAVTASRCCSHFLVPAAAVCMHRSSFKAALSSQPLFCQHPPLADLSPGHGFES